MSGHDHHALAESSREQGEFLKSLQESDAALINYQEENDIDAFADVLGTRMLTLRHLFEKTSEKAYLVLAKHEAMAAVEIAPNAMAFYNLGRIHDTLDEIEQAIENYKKAIEEFKQNPPENNNRPAVLLDMQINLAAAEYKNGETEALERLLTALEELEKTDESKYNKDVWTTGGYMKLAQLSKDKKYLDKAKEIIDANPELVLRKKQWEKINQNFS